MGTRLDLYETSGGRHLCVSCIHAEKMNDNDLIMTTMDYNSCDLRYESNVRDVDNGSGYWIVACDNYVPGKYWDKIRYYDYIKSDKWKEKRLKALKRDGYRCQNCGSAINLCVHHITYDRLGNEETDDLITLCKTCHQKVHETDLKEAQ